MSSADRVGATPRDVDILNTALGAEHQAIAAYQVGAENGLLGKPMLGVALKFQSDPKEHADLLSKTVKKLGGEAAVAMKPAEKPWERCVRMIEKPTSQARNAQPSPVRMAGPNAATSALQGRRPGRQSGLNKLVIRWMSA